MILWTFCGRGNICQWGAGELFFKAPFSLVWQFHFNKLSGVFFFFFNLILYWETFLTVSSSQSVHLPKCTRYRQVWIIPLQLFSTRHLHSFTMLSFSNWLRQFLNYYTFLWQEKKQNKLNVLRILTPKIT